MLLLRLDNGVDALAVDVAAGLELLAPAQQIAERHHGFEIVGPRRDQLFEMALGLLGAVERVEIDGELNLGVAPQRRFLGHALIGLDGELRFLEIFVEVREREQRERLLGREIDRKL